MKMKKMAALKILFAAPILVASSTLYSCASLQQDVVISTIPSEEQKEISDYEFRLSFLDANWSFDKKEYYTPEEIREKTNACNALLKDVKKSLSKNNLIGATTARLKAIEGRVYLILGDSINALAAFYESQNLFAYDIQQIILGYRLGLIPNLSLSHYSPNDKPLILLEEALSFYSEKKYPEAVAKFDESFISSQSFYYDAYKDFRNKAWEYRSITEEDTLTNFLSIKQISLGQMMMMSQEYPAIIDFYTGNAKLSEEKLFRKLVQKGTLTSAIKEKPPVKIYYTTMVTRKIQARFLWNIFCDVKGKHKIKNKNSTLYSKSNRQSPVLDVSVTDEDFDAILGCIEYGLLNLLDGKSFYPDNSISGIEFNESLKKLNNKL